MLLLSRTDVASLLDMSQCIDAVEGAFRSHARGDLPCEPGVLGSHVPGGGIHIKTAGISGSQRYFAAKINANFPANPRTTGRPTIQGVIALFELESGQPLAVLDSIEITALRTAAATVVAARHLARTNSTTVTICGCGRQGRAHLEAIALVPSITTIFLYDQDPALGVRLADALSAELALSIRPIRSLADAVAASDICVLCTPATSPVFPAAFLHPGLFVAAVGADNPDKQELEPEVLARSKVVVDIPEQVASMGDLHHAIAAGRMTADQVHGTLGQIVAGQRSGRLSPDEVFVFDSTGTALQDVVAAVLVYERALLEGRGLNVALAR